MNTLYHYPPMPPNTDPAVIRPSAAFKKNVVNVILAMLLFVVVYLLLLVAAVAIAIAFGLAGAGLMSAYPSFLTLVLGLGLIFSGLMLLYFLVKFIFKRSVTDRSGMLEVTRQDQPELFEFIRQLTTETKSPFPKRIYLTADVNAGVFYDSSFWSMFFPVRKNLQIGLGLINCLNLSEFKAVMAHEFGHFSQRSMKFGSYTYNMNRVIYNMLYDNDSYAKTLDAVGRIHSFVRLGVYINIQMVRGIQELLKKIYIVVNRNYLSLSRQMEFHADAISAYVTGSNQTISSLRRIELSQLCYNSMFSYLNVLAKDKKRPESIYPTHMAVMNLFAGNHQLQVDATGMPVINKKLAVLNNTQIVIADQWSSHPSMDEREQHLNAIHISSPVTDTPAWALFRDVEQLQRSLSNIVYESVTEKYDVIDAAAVKQRFDEEAEANTYNKIYKGYYNGRHITCFDVDGLIALPYQNTGLSFNQWFADEQANLPERISGLEADINTARAIYEGTAIKTFDFKGNRYTQIDAPNVEKHLQAELKEAREKLIQSDKDIFLFCYHHSANGGKIAEAYRQFFPVQQQTQDMLAACDELLAAMNPVYSNMQQSDIELTLNKVYELEKTFKPKMQDLLNNAQYQASVGQEEHEAIEDYLSKDWVYYATMYNNTTIAKFNKAMNAYYAIVNGYYFTRKKHLLNLQLDE